MRKELLYITFFAMLLASCEEYYKPDLEEVAGHLVVESHLTNDPKQNFVKLSRALNFYSNEPTEKIKGAQVELIGMGGQITDAVEISSGYYTFTVAPVPGKLYYLRISFKDDIYESDRVIMPPLPTIDTLYTKHKIENSFRTDGDGNPTPIQIPGRDICIDAPISRSLEYYRFGWRAIIQWSLSLPATDGPPPPPVYGWFSRYDNDLFNIAGLKKFSVSGKVKNHPILFIGYNSQSYLDTNDKVASGWIVIVNQYGISKESYNFHEELNKQISAEGSLFDPVLSQVYGNIHCKTDPKKIALGFFDLNSYRQYRYFLRLGYNESSFVNLRQINRYPDIPDEGTTVGFIPDFWEN